MTPDEKTPKKSSSSATKAKTPSSSGKKDSASVKKEPLDSDLLRPPKVKKDHKVKKEVPDEDFKPLKSAKKEDSNDIKPPKSKKEQPSPDVKPQVKNSTDKKKVKKVNGTEVKEKKERKVYDLPGQKHDPPEEREPLRIFYETLYNQRPDSDMAQFWMMEHGLLPLAEAKKAFEKKQRSKQPGKVVAPGKVSTPVKSEKKSSVKSNTNTSSKSKKKKSEVSDSDDDSDDELIMPTKKIRKHP